MLYSNGRAIICLYLIKKGIFKIEISIDRADAKAKLSHAYLT